MSERSKCCTSTYAVTLPLPFWFASALIADLGGIAFLICTALCGGSFLRERNMAVTAVICAMTLCLLGTVLSYCEIVREKKRKASSMTLAEIGRGFGLNAAMGLCAFIASLIGVFLTGGSARFIAAAISSGVGVLGILPICLSLRKQRAE